MKPQNNTPQHLGFIALGFVGLAETTQNESKTKKTRTRIQGPRGTYIQPKTTQIMKNRTFLNLLGLGYACALGSPSASAATFINFETSQGYATAPAAFVTGTNQGSATFTGPNGWSESTSSDVGALIATSTSGSYVGGQALSTTTNGGSASYIGGINLGLAGFTSITFDIGTQAGANGGTYEAMVAGWVDTTADGKLSQSEAGPLGGFRGGQFAIRQAGYGTTFSTGLAPTVGDFYQMTLGYNFGTTTVTLDAFDLTTGLAVDLNGASAGNTWSVTNASIFGATPVDPATYTGVAARVSGFGIADNITVVPEPSTVASLLGGVGMLALRRRRGAAPRV